MNGASLTVGWLYYYVLKKIYKLKARLQGCTFLNIISKKLYQKGLIALCFWIFVNITFYFKWLPSKAQWGNGNWIPSPYIMLPLSWKLKSHQQTHSNIFNIIFLTKVEFEFIRIRAKKKKVTLLMYRTYIT